MAANSRKLSRRRARVLRVCLLAAALLAAFCAAADRSRASLQGTTAEAVFPCASPPTTGLAAWWPGDEDTSDLRGLNPGHLAGACCVLFSTGKVGGAFKFNGTDYVRVPNSPSLNASESLTLDAWIFVPNTPSANDPNTDATIIGKWGDSGSYLNQRAYRLSYLGKGRIRFSISDDAHQADATFHNFDTVENIVPLNGWVHVAAVFDKNVLGGQRRIYINGALVQLDVNGGVSVSLKQSTADLSVGAQLSDANVAARFFNGLIDEPSVYTRALSQQEVGSIFQAGSLGKCRTTFTVANTADDGAGSLRQAITDSNNIQGRQTIAFNIPVAGVHAILPEKATLPDITDPVTIDGFTQPLSKPNANTLADGDNSNHLIVLNGELVPANSSGLHITATAGGTTVRGLVINEFSIKSPAQGNAIWIQNSDGNHIEGCFIGTNVSGAGDFGNNASGIYVQNGFNNTIGGATPDKRNVISGNVDGIFLDGGGSNTIAGNYIGTTRGGDQPLGNSIHNVVVNGSFSNLIGGTTPAAGNVIAASRGVGIHVRVDGSGNNTKIIGNYIGTNPSGANLGNRSHGIKIETTNNVIGDANVPVTNVIAFNGGDGISILSGAGNRIEGSRNSIYSNGGLGIDLGDDGVILAGAGSGPNRRQPFPTLTSAVVNGNVTVNGSLISDGSTKFLIQFFSNDACDPTGFGEGQTFLGETNVTTRATGGADIKNLIIARATAGQFVTATATNLATNDTSEFSKCVKVEGSQQITVANANDDGNGSLRRALDDIVDGGTIDFGSNAKGVVALKQPLDINKRVTIVGPAASAFILSGGGATRVLNVGPSGDVNVSSVTFSNGKADDGGAIRNAGKLTLTDSTVSQSAATLSGGGVYNAGQLAVERSTFSKNSAASDGGGIFNTRDLSVVNSTVSDNGALARGAGIANDGGHASITACTIADNSSQGQAGAGAGVANASGTVAIRSSIVADNTSRAAPDDLSGVFDSLVYNLVESMQGATVTGESAHNITGKSPLLGLLKNNDGRTETRALLAGSPALDAGDDALALATDQRGRPRKIDGDSNGSAAVDIGAFESGFNVSGKAQDVTIADNVVNLEGIKLTLNSNSISPRTATSTAADSGNNFNVMDVPEGVGYTLTAEAPADVNAQFDFVFTPVCFDVSAAGVLSDCVTHAALTGLKVGGTKQARQLATFGGRVTDTSGKGLGGVTLTLSGRKTVVKTLPECNGDNDPACGNYFFDQVPTLADYTLTPSKGTLGFVTSADSTEFDNHNGGAFFEKIGLVDKGTAFTANFNGGSTAAPTPPPPSDDFTNSGDSLSRFSTGLLSLKPESFDTGVNVTAGNGALQITTPPTLNASAQQSSSQANAPQREVFNGFVSKRAVDLNSSTSVSVRADEPLADGCGQTVFSFGSDSEHFFRIRVGDPSSTLGQGLPAPEICAGGQKASASASATPTPVMFFETRNGRDASNFKSVPMSFDGDADKYWRLRHEPRTPSPPDVCKDAAANAAAKGFVIYETGPTRSTLKPRYCAGVFDTNNLLVATEQLAGVVGNNTRDPRSAKFRDYNVADRSVITFDESNASEAVKSVQVIQLGLARGGEVSSAASVVVNVSGDADVAPSRRAVYFKANEDKASFSFANPVPDAVGGDHLLTLTLTDASGGALDDISATADFKIRDDGFRGNRIQEPTFFTSQQYCDFLGREADAEGRDFWAGQFAHCAGDAACVERERVHVSSAFFFSIEFQQTGMLSYLANKAAFGNLEGKPVPVTFNQFKSDVRVLGAGVQVNVGDWRQQLEQNKLKYFQQLADSQRFRDRYGGMKSTDFVDTLFANAGVTPAADERASLVLISLTQPETSRALVLRRVAENAAFAPREQNRALVLMQYFGYLQRDPDAAPEANLNFDGYNFWLGKLEDAGGDFVKAEMVKAFINSEEYRLRFNGRQTPTCGL